MEEESLLVALSSHSLIELGSVVKVEAFSCAFKRASAFSITSFMSAAIKDLIPSNFSIEETTKSLPAVALDEEGSYPLLVRCLGSEAALFAVKEAEINGSSLTVALVWLLSDTQKVGPCSLRDLKGTASSRFRPLQSMSQFSNQPRSNQTDSWMNEKSRALYPKWSKMAHRFKLLKRKRQKVKKNLRIHSEINRFVNP